MEAQSKWPSCLLPIKEFILYREDVEPLLSRKNYSKWQHFGGEQRRVIYLYAIMMDIEFDVGKAKETSILIITTGKHNLGHPALIF